MYFTFESSAQPQNKTLTMDTGKKLHNNHMLIIKS